MFIVSFHPFFYDFEEYFMINDETNLGVFFLYLEFAYSSALTDIVGELEELERLTKEVCGEMPLDVPNL